MRDGQAGLGHPPWRGGGGWGVGGGGGGGWGGRLEEGVFKRI